MHLYHSLGHLLFIKDHNELLVIGLLLMQNILLKCSRMNQQNQTFPLKMEDSLEIMQTNDVNVLFEKMQLRTVKWFVQGDTVIVLRLQLLLCLVGNTILSYYAHKCIVLRMKWVFQNILIQLQRRLIFDETHDFLSTNCYCQ